MCDTNMNTSGFINMDGGESESVNEQKFISPCFARGLFVILHPEICFSTKLSEMLMYISAKDKNWTYSITYFNIILKSEFKNKLPSCVIIGVIIGVSHAILHWHT